MTDVTKVELGVTFHAIVGDANLEWVVKQKLGQGVWKCEVSPSEIDYKGTVKTFMDNEILASHKMASFFKEIDARNQSYIETLMPGDVVHYHNSFGQYVRCVVFDELDGGENVLRPIALVGDWQPYDLPGYTDAGVLREGGYWVRKVREHEMVQPNAQSIYESPEFVGPNGPARELDPRDLPAISLEVPEPTAEQLGAHKLLNIINEIREETAWPGGQSSDFIGTYQEQLRAVRELLNSPEVEALLDSDSPAPRM